MKNCNFILPFFHACMIKIKFTFFHSQNFPITNFLFTQINEFIKIQKKKNPVTCLMCENTPAAKEIKFLVLNVAESFIVIRSNV